MLSVYTVCRVSQQNKRSSHLFIVNLEVVAVLIRGRVIISDAEYTIGQGHEIYPSPANAMYQIRVEICFIW